MSKTLKNFLKNKKKVNKFSCALSLFIIIYWFFERTYISIYTALFSVFFLPLMILAFGIGALVYAFCYLKESGIFTFIPFLMLVGTLLLSPLVARIHLQTNYYLHQNQRETIIAQIKESPQQIEQYSKELPEELRGASKGGKIFVERTEPALQVEFEAVAWAYQWKWKIIYSSDGEIEWNDSREITVWALPLDENWYAVINHRLSKEQVRGAPTNPLTIWNYISG